MQCIQTLRSHNWSGAHLFLQPNNLLFRGFKAGFLAIWGDKQTRLHWADIIPLEQAHNSITPWSFVDVAPVVGNIAHRPRPCQMLNLSQYGEQPKSMLLFFPTRKKEKANAIRKYYEDNNCDDFFDVVINLPDYLNPLRTQDPTAAVLFPRSRMMNYFSPTENRLASLRTVQLGGIMRIRYFSTK